MVFPEMRACPRECHPEIMANHCNCSPLVIQNSVQNVFDKLIVIQLVKKFPVFTVHQVSKKQATLRFRDPVESSPQAHVIFISEMVISHSHQRLRPTYNWWSSPSGS
jgi:hypothetical protein